MWMDGRTHHPTPPDGQTDAAERKTTAGTNADGRTDTPPRTARSPLIQSTSQTDGQHHPTPPGHITTSRTDGQGQLRYVPSTKTAPVVRPLSLCPADHTAPLGPEQRWYKRRWTDGQAGQCMPKHGGGTTDRQTAAAMTGARYKNSSCAYRPRLLCPDLAGCPARCASSRLRGFDRNLSHFFSFLTPARPGGARAFRVCRI